MILRMLSLVLVVTSSSLCAENDVNNEAAAMAAYQSAISKVRQERKLIEAGHSISYRETIEEKVGRRKSVEKIVRLDKRGNEILESSSTEDAGSSLSWNFSVLVNPSSFPRNARLIGESEKTWVFAIPTKIQASIEEVEQNANENQVNNAIVDALNTELVISKADARLLSRKIYAPSPFKPQSMVTINDFKVRIEYSRAWEEGPWVAKSISRSLVGKYAFFVSVEEFSLVRNEQFKLVQ